MGWISAEKGGKMEGREIRCREEHRENRRY